MSEGRSDNAIVSSGVMQLGVLRVMASCLESIAVVLSHPEHVPSRDLLMKYFTKQTVAKISALLHDDGEIGVIDKAALPLFLQITANVWKFKDSADRTDLAASIDDAVDLCLSRYGQYPRHLQCSCAIAIVQLCRGNDPVLHKTITTALVDFENWLIKGSSTSPPLGTASLRAAVDIFGAAVASEQVMHGLEGMLPRLRSIVDTVVTHDVNTMAALLREETSEPDHYGGIGQCLVRVVLLWATFTLRTSYVTRDAADSAVSILGDVLEWATKTLVPSICRCTSSMYQSADSCHLRVLYDMLASVLLVVTDALIINSFQQCDHESLAVLMKEVLLSLDRTPYVAPDTGDVYLPAVLCRLESVLRSQHIPKFGAQLTASVTKAISVLGCAGYTAHTSETEPYDIPN